MYALHEKGKNAEDIAIENNSKQNKTAPPQMRQIFLYR